MGHKFKQVAKTLFGFEEILAKELRDLGALNIEPDVRVVSYEGDNSIMYKANLACRTAIKILKPIHNFTTRHEDQFYRNIYKMDWELYLDNSKTLAIDATVHSDYFNHSKYIALKAKDAIVDKFRDLTGERPNVDTDEPDLRINIHIHQDSCTVSLDSSGHSLHRRGYRRHVGSAPINEVLAAGLLMQSGWNGQCDFLDPMCGSGTIPIEATMIACNMPANINRTSFNFMRWADWDEELFEKIKKDELAKTRDCAFTIRGFEINPKLADLAKENVEAAGLEDFIKIAKQDFFKSEKPSDTPLHIFFNPPYDERIEIEETEEFYGEIGDTLKQQYTNTNAWIVTANLEGLKSVGLRTSKRIICYNGPLEARLVKYEMYAGTRKKKKMPKNLD